MVSTPKKILFISYDGMTDPLGQSQVIPYLQGLSRNGYQIFLLSCEKKQVFASNKPLVENMLAGYNIEWITLTYTKKPPILSTILDIRKLKRKAVQLHSQHSIDMVHTRPGVPALVGQWLKKKYAIKFLNDIREFYADSRVDGKMWNLKNPLYKTVYNWFKKKETEQVKLSDGIVCLTYAAEKIIKQWPAYNATTPLEVIPCSADLNLFDPAKITEEEKNNARKQLHITNSDFIVSYLGSIGGWYLTDEMLQFCKVLSNKIPAAKFLFISPHRHADILQAAGSAGITAEKIIAVKASRQQVPLMLSLSNYSVFFIRPCYSKQSSSPTKHGEIMAMGIPLITNSGVGDVAEIVTKYHSGIIINEFSETAYEKAADEISKGNNFDAATIQKGAGEFYSLEKAVEKYTRIYNRILQH